MFSHGSTELPHDAIRQHASNENHDGQVTISTTRSCAREWWKRSRDSTNKSLEEKKETYKKRRKGRYEEEEENNWMEHGRNGEMAFFLLMIGQSLVGVTASSENVPSNRRQMEGIQGERKMNERSWVQINQRTSRLRKCRSEMQNESKMHFTNWFSVEHGVRLQHTSLLS